VQPTSSGWRLRRSRRERGVTVVCLGNPARGDDGAGHLVADLLTGTPNIRVVKAHSAAEALHTIMTPQEKLIIVDAVERVTKVGRIHRLRDLRRLSSQGGWRSSHTMPLNEVLELAEALGVLPPKITIYGIEGDCFEPGSEMSPKVREACRGVASEIRRAASAKRQKAKGLPAKEAS
jgi:hydrogenase maturation protease